MFEQWPVMRTYDMLSLSLPQGAINSKSLSTICSVTAIVPGAWVNQWSKIPALTGLPISQEGTDTEQ